MLFRSPNSIGSGLTISTLAHLDAAGLGGVHFIDLRASFTITVGGRERLAGNAGFHVRERHESKPPRHVSNKLPTAAQLQLAGHARAGYG